MWQATTDGIYFYANPIKLLNCYSYIGERQYFDKQIIITYLLSQRKSNCTYLDLDEIYLIVRWTNEISASLDEEKNTVGLYELSPLIITLHEYKSCFTENNTLYGTCRQSTGISMGIFGCGGAGVILSIISDQNKLMAN